MSVNKIRTSTEGQNTNIHLQQIITSYFTPRENKHKQRRQIKNKPEVYTKHRTAATGASNKEKNPMDMINKTLTGTKIRNEDESEKIISVKVKNRTINLLTKSQFFQMY